MPTSGEQEKKVIIHNKSWNNQLFYTLALSPLSNYSLSLTPYTNLRLQSIPQVRDPNSNYGEIQGISQH